MMENIVLSKILIMWGITTPISLYFLFKEGYDEEFGDILMMIIFAPIMAVFGLLIFIMAFKIKRGKKGRRPISY